MFDFLSKRPGGKPDDLPGAVTLPGEVPSDAVASARAMQAEKVKELAGNESAAADFILHSEFSELRLAAAQYVHSAEQLERVHAAIRNTDRRVAKLMQSRLDAIRHHDAEVRKAQACIGQARVLLAEEKLTPNQVADLDRMWSVIAAPELAEEFGAVRTGLGQRLEAQMALQRNVIDTLARLRQLDLRTEGAAQRLAELEQAHAAALAAPEHASLPRGLLNEFDAELAQRKTAWAKPAEPVAPAPVAEAPAAPAPEAAPPKPRPLKVQGPGPDQRFLDTITAMEAALAEGALHVANDLDRVLRDSKGFRLTPALVDRLAHARAELKRLSDWARWGGNVSREELVKAAEQLHEQKIAMSELAKKVGSLRDRWKKLDSVSGAAPKSLWERFDAACTAAYAPAAAHFRHLADERHANAARGQALLDEVAAEAARFAEEGAHDWKHIAAAAQRLTLAWSHLGPIDRKEKKRLDSEFNRALQVLQAPLAAQRAREADKREELIDQVAALDPHDRRALDIVRQVQEQWQQAARALPLERKVEQALWQRFRAACDALFARRKENAHAADAERRAHLHAKEALCERLEACEDAANAARILRETAAEWHAIGPVPRASEAKIDKRYHAAVSALQHKMDVARHAASMAQAGTLRDKLRLVQELEAAVVDGQDGADDWSARWSALADLPGDFERVLRTRFDAAQDALSNGRDAYAARLQQNRDQLMHDLLKLEIVAGVDSGPEFARDRLKLQVEVLQSSLKSGRKPVTHAAQFLDLIGLPALSDARTATRIEHLYPRIGKEHK